MIRTSSVVAPEHEAYLYERGFRPVWMDDFGKLYFIATVEGSPHMRRVIAKQKFGPCWRVALQTKTQSLQSWVTIWLAGYTYGGSPAEPSALLFDDPVTAYLHAEVSAWGAGQ